jgi:hypothetical protein
MYRQAPSEKYFKCSVFGGRMNRGECSNGTRKYLYTPALTSWDPLVPAIKGYMQS